MEKWFIHSRFFSRSIMQAGVLAALLFITSVAAAQDDYDPDLQPWNELELVVPVNEKLDLNFVGTFRADHDISRSNSLRFSAGATFKPVASFSASGYHTFISGRSSAGQMRYEYRTGARAVYRLPVKALSVSHRSQFEHRIRPGRNSWRYRPSITIRKSLPEAFLKNASLFVTEEPLYDSVSGRFSRNRLSVGIRKAANKKFSVDLYYLFQGDNFSSPGAAHILGTGWKITL
jgi:hypothetical protein